ncbi:hypothetical protein D3C86_1563100 [compost metagenome]
MMVGQTTACTRQHKPVSPPVMIRKPLQHLGEQIRRLVQTSRVQRQIAELEQDLRGPPQGQALAIGRFRAERVAGLLEHIPQLQPAAWPFRAQDDMLTIIINRLAPAPLSLGEARKTQHRIGIGRAADAPAPSEQASQNRTSHEGAVRPTA